MSLNIAVYCTQSLAHLTGSQLWQWLDQADLHFLAEWFGIEDEEVVDTALKYLRLEPSDQTSLSTLHLYYRPEGVRPILIERRGVGADVQALVQEELGELKRGTKSGIERVRAHLTQVQETVTIEFGSVLTPHAMGAALAYEVARWIAKSGQWYVKDDDQVWWTLDDWTWKCVYPERE